MAKKPIPETTDCELDMAECKALRRQIAEAQKVYEDKKADAKLAKQAVEAMIDELLAKLSDDDTPLFAAREDEDE